MFKEKCFTEEWLQSFKRQEEYIRIDVIILEKMIYALHLLEQHKADHAKAKNYNDLMGKDGAIKNLLLNLLN